MIRLPTLLAGALGTLVASSAVASVLSPTTGALAQGGPPAQPAAAPKSGGVVSASRKAPPALRGEAAAVAAARQLTAAAEVRLRSAVADLRTARRRDAAPARVNAAAAAVRTAEQVRAQADAVMDQVRRPGAATGPGAAKFARECVEAGVIGGICRPVPWREDHLGFDSVVVSRTVHARWPQIRKIYGWRPWDAYPDHPAGRAVDVMIPAKGRGYDRALGDEIAGYFQRHAEEHGIYYILWRQRMWLAGNDPGAWSRMSDRGSASGNHMDHVHISVRGSSNSRVFRSLIQELAA